MTTQTRAPQQAGRSSKLRSNGNLPTRARARGQIVIGILLVVGAALVGALVFLNAGDRVSALAVREEIPAGQQITRDDLISTSVAGVAGAVPVEDVDEVIGKTPKVGLVAGQVLTRDAITSEQLPGEGRAMAGLALTAAQMPGDGVKPGDQVRVLAVPGADTAASGDLGSSVTVLAPAATVYAVRAATTGEASKIVTVVVPADAADTIAVHAAAGRVAIVKVEPTTTEEQ